MNLLAAPILAVWLVAAASAPADVTGWRKAHWGMDEAALERAFGAELGRLPGRWVHGGAYATRMIQGVMVGGQGFRAIFQMGDTSARLQQVLLEPERRPGQEARFRSSFGALKKAYGEPTGSCAVPRAGGGPLSVEIWWVFPTTTVHLTYFDFFTRAMAFEDPNRDRDPLVPYVDVRRNNPRFLPRRTVLRFHASDRIDLMSRTCG